MGPINPQHREDLCRNGLMIARRTLLLPPQNKTNYYIWRARQHVCVCYWGTHQLSQPPVNPASYLLRTPTCNFMPLLFLSLIGLGAWVPFWLRKSSCNVVVHTKNNWCFSFFHVLNLVVNNSFSQKPF